MKQFTAQEIQAKFETLPKELQIAIASPEINKKIEDIGNRHNLLINQIGELVDQIGLVMLGLEKGTNFVSDLTERLSISRNDAQIIANEVNSEVFSAIKTSMREATEPHYQSHECISNNNADRAEITFKKFEDATLQPSQNLLEKKQLDTWERPAEPAAQQPIQPTPTPPITPSVAQPIKVITNTTLTPVTPVKNMYGTALEHAGDFALEKPEPAKVVGWGTSEDNRDKFIDHIENPPWQRLTTTTAHTLDIPEEVRQPKIEPVPQYVKPTITPVPTPKVQVIKPVLELLPEPVKPMAYLASETLSEEAPEAAEPVMKSPPEPVRPIPLVEKNTFYTPAVVKQEIPQPLPETKREVPKVVPDAPANLPIEQEVESKNLLDTWKMKEAEPDAQTIPIKIPTTLTEVSQSPATQNQVPVMPPIVPPTPKTDPRPYDPYKELIV